MALLGDGLTVSIPYASPCTRHDVTDSVLALNIKFKKQAFQHELLKFITFDKLLHWMYGIKPRALWDEVMAFVPFLVISIAL